MPPAVNDFFLMRRNQTLTEFSIRCLGGSSQKEIERGSSKK
jgi:hypothetical protein